MPIWWPRPREPQWMVTTHSPSHEAESLRGFAVEDFRHLLDFEVVIAGTQRAHLALLAFARPVGDGSGRRSSAQPSSSMKSRSPRFAVAFAQRPARRRRPASRPCRDSSSRMSPCEPTPAGMCANSASASGLPARLDLVAAQAGQVGAHAAGDVEADAAGRDDAALVGVEGGDAADREAVAPVGVRHRVRGADDAGQGGHVDQLLAHLVVHVADQFLAGVDDGGHAHLAAGGISQ